MCSVLLAVSGEHDPVCIGDVVGDEDVCMYLSTLVWSEWLFELPGVSSSVPILVC